MIAEQDVILFVSSPFLSGEFHVQRSLTGYSLWGHKESDMTELHTYFLYLPVFLTFY